MVTPLLIKNQAKNDKSLNVNIYTKSRKKRNFFHSQFFIVIFLSMWILMLANIFLELREVRLQMHYFIFMYEDKYNPNNSVKASNRSVDYNNSVSPTISSNFSNLMEVRDRHTDTIMLRSYKQIVSDRSTYHENNSIKKNASNLSDAMRFFNKMMASLSDFNKKQQNFQYFETQNYMTTEAEMSSDYELITWSEPYARRFRRMKRDTEERQSEEGEGKIWHQSEEESEKQRQSKENEEIQRQSKETGEKRQRKKNKERQNEKKSGKRQRERKSQIQKQNERKGGKRRQNRKGPNQRQSRPLVATFVGAVPELTNTVYIGPWTKSENENQYDFTKFHLVENNMSIQVGISGLYMISVQIYYFGSPTNNNSYWMLLNSEGSSTKRKIVTCSASVSKEVSCYTSVVIYLQNGDRLSLQQQEKNRLINMRKGYSQIQIMLLANDRGQVVM